MSNPYLNNEEYPPEPVPAQNFSREDTPPKKKGTLRKILPYALTAIIAGALGAASASSSDAEPTSQPEPEIVTETVTETITEEVTVTHGSCLSAVDSGDRLIEIYSEALILASEALGAYEAFDFDGLDQKTADINALSDELSGELMTYYLESDECRANA